MSDEDWKRHRDKRQQRKFLIAFLLAILLLPLYKFSQAVSYDRVGGFGRGTRGQVYALFEAPSAFYWNAGLWGGFCVMVLYAVFKLWRDRS